MQSFSAIIVITMDSVPKWIIYICHDPFFKDVSSFRKEFMQHPKYYRVEV